MHDYRLYRLDGSGRVESATEFQAECDADAVAQVDLTVAAPWELWSRDRIVRTPGGDITAGQAAS